MASWKSDVLKNVERFIFWKRKKGMKFFPSSAPLFPLKAALAVSRREGKPQQREHQEEEGEKIVMPKNFCAILKKNPPTFFFHGPQTCKS